MITDLRFLWIPKPKTLMRSESNQIALVICLWGSGGIVMIDDDLDHVLNYFYAFHYVLNSNRPSYEIEQGIVLTHFVDRV